MWMPRRFVVLATLLMSFLTMVSMTAPAVMAAAAAAPVVMVSAPMVSGQSPLGQQSPTTGLILKDDAVVAFIHESSGDRAHQSVQRLALWARDNEAHYNVAAEWVKQMAEASGLQDVQIEAEEKNPSWRASKGELWASQPYRFKITSFDDLPMSLVSGSASVKLKDIDLVDVGEGLVDSDYATKNVRGKIVLTSGRPNPVLNKALKEKGALGVLSSYTTPPWNEPNRLEGDFPDQVGWARAIKADDFPGQKPFAFMISARSAKELQSILKKGAALKLDITIESEVLPDNYNTVSGIIPGSKYPNEEIVVTSHLDHYRPGADDNASGSASTLEIARTLNQLIKEGKIAAPLRTIRFLWVREFSGTKDWLERHSAEPIKRIANFNFDMLGANLLKMRSVFSVSYTPDWNPSFINAVAESILSFSNRFNAYQYPVRKDFHIISVNGTRDPLNGRMERYSRGSDHQIFNDYGIPGIGYVTWPDDAYHTSEDKPENVDPTQLHRVIVSGLAAISVAAYASDVEAADLGRLVQSYGFQRIAGDEMRAMKRINSADASRLIDEAYFAKAILTNAYACERKALASCSTLAPNSSAVLQRMAKAFDDAEALAVRRLSESVLERAEELHITYAEKTLSASEVQASKIIPVRSIGKELETFSEAVELVEAKDSKQKSLIDNVKNAVKAAEEALRRQGESELRFYEMEDAIRSYANDQRSVLEIRDAVFSEYDHEFPIDALVDLFKIFEKAGIVSFKSHESH